ncbi:MAG TPA: pyrroline-5-carboxylate reductase [Acidimicrobiales bacterium]|jgi:pyrroline-5-carboxylate reductase|nr:pyrroline-5-carboxylate reductase [Acidimicrobiales bacterium]
MSSLLIVGGGKMGSALLGGLLRSGWVGVDDVVVIEPLSDRRADLAAQHPGLRTIAFPEEGLLGDGGERLRGAVLATKPDQAEGACRALGVTGVTRVLSIVAGVPSARLETALGGQPHVVRAMPNTPALVGAGVTAISGGSFATSHDLAWADEVLSAVGSVVRLPERMLDAVTGLSGSGPAYFFLVAESLIEAGVQMGLARDVSRTLVVETMLGSATLLKETGRDPEALRAEVTSPAGTTAAGIRTLEARAVRSAFMEAVAAATERSRNLQR